MDNFTLTERDFPGATSAGAGLSRKTAATKQLSSDWKKAEILASAQLNPPEPYARQEFDPVFFGVFRKS